MRNAITSITLFEILYSYLLNFRLNSTSNLAKAENFIKNREIIKKNLENVTELANTKISVYFNKQYRSPHFTSKIYIRLVKNRQKKYQLLQSSKLSTIRIKLYPIKRKIRELVYKLELPVYT